VSKTEIIESGQLRLGKIRRATGGNRLTLGCSGADAYGQQVGVSGQRLGTWEMLAGAAKVEKKQTKAGRTNPDSKEQANELKAEKHCQYTGRRWSVCAARYIQHETHVAGSGVRV
jgi:hypothetical protein